MPDKWRRNGWLILLLVLLASYVQAADEINTTGTKVRVQSIQDGYGFTVENTPMDEMRVVQPYRLVGSTFGDAHDPRFWSQLSGVSQNYVYQGSQVVLEASGTNTTAILQSTRTARYIGASSNRYRTILRFPDSGTANNYRRWGAFDASNGAFFEVSGNSTLSVVTRKNAVDTKVSSGSFNGTYGDTLAIDTSVATWEIYWTNSKVYFVKSGKILHTVTASSAVWSNSMNLPIRYENVNTNASSTDVSLNVRVGTISRLGKDSTQATSYFQAGQTAGVQLKRGTGNLHGVVISGVANNSVVTLYDGTSTAGTVIWASGAMTANTTPFALEMHDIPFYTGLFLAITAADSNALIAYE